LAILSTGIDIFFIFSSGFVSMKVLRV